MKKRIALVIVPAGLLVWGGIRLFNRAQYCEVACLDMRVCNFSVPHSCELQCIRGHRRIDLPTNCDDLAEHIDHVEGYLW